MEDKKSICALEMGQETAAARALGGGFQLEDCGFFGNCSHRVEYFDYSTGKEDYVEVFYCATDHWKVGFAVVAVIILVFVLYRKVRRAPSAVLDAA